MSASARFPLRRTVGRLTTRGRALSFCALLLLMPAATSRAQQVRISLDLYFSQPEYEKLGLESPNGYWELVSYISDPNLPDSDDTARGIAGIVARLADLCPETDSVEDCHLIPLAPQASVLDEIVGFRDFFRFRDDQVPPHWEFTFSQIPGLAGEDQGVLYDVGLPGGANRPGDLDTPPIPGFDPNTDPGRNIPWSFDDALGDLIGDGDQSNNNGMFHGGVVLVAGTFAAETTPSFVGFAGGSVNVLASLGDTIIPPAIATAVLASQFRDNTVTIAGDANLDGAVDAGDLNQLGVHWSETILGWKNGDFTADGIVNAADLNALAIHWQLQAAMADTVTVPEPTVYWSACTILLLGWTQVRKRWRDG